MQFSFQRIEILTIGATVTYIITLILLYQIIILYRNLESNRNDIYIHTYIHNIYTPIHMHSVTHVTYYDTFVDIIYILRSCLLALL